MARPDGAALGDGVSESERRTAVSSLIATYGMWAIGDDYDLANAVERSGRGALLALVSAVDALPESVWEWLAGRESSMPHPSDEYIAVSEITIAADLARVTLNERDRD
jgi:hypothetical protein